MAQRSPLRLLSASSRCLKEKRLRYPCLLRRYESDLVNNQPPKEAAPPPPSGQPLDADSSLRAPGPTEELIKSFNPAEQARKRRALLGRELPPSRYRFRPPKYYRGPLHPHQPPPPSDPASRQFVPGPFSLPRLQQTYTSTLRPDLMTLSYVHIPPGMQPPLAPQRLRTWDDSSPYHKNRPVRGPRGIKPRLPLLRRPITFRNVPAISCITVHCMVPDAQKDSAYLHVAGMALQAITGARAVVHNAKKTIPEIRGNHAQREGKPISLSVNLKNEDMYDFLAKVVEVVLPGIKDWKGVSGNSGDGSGNLAFTLDREVVGAFPEIEVNYDS
ncbi:MAG: hypothetical protein MMC33_001061 [Icmadophila ericetorum]|nr:hypothetical protein [Icmadophila ericetorum]